MPHALRGGRTALLSTDLALRVLVVVSCGSMGFIPPELRERRVGVQQMDADIVESVAGIVRLLRRAAELVWAQADGQGPRSPRQLFALGLDLAADEARNLLPDTVSMDGPIPVGTEPAGLLRSAEQLLRHVCAFGAPAEVDGLHARVVELAWEANTGAGA
jgi:hypothetical protein